MKQQRLYQYTNYQQGAGCYLGVTKSLKMAGSVFSVFNVLSQCYYGAC